MYTVQIVLVVAVDAADVVVAVVVAMKAVRRDCYCSFVVVGVQLPQNWRKGWQLQRPPFELRLHGSIRALSHLAVGGCE